MLYASIIHGDLSEFNLGGSSRAQGLDADLRAFYQQKQFVSQQFRVFGFHLQAQLRQLVPQISLMHLDDLARWVIFFGEVCRCVCDGAAARVRVGDVFGEQGKCGLDLLQRIIGKFLRLRCRSEHQCPEISAAIKFLLDLLLGIAMSLWG